MAKCSCHFADFVSLSGYSAIAGPSGNLIAVSEMDQEEVIRAVLEEDELVHNRSTRNVFRDRRPELYGLLCAPIQEGTIHHLPDIGSSPQAPEALKEGD